MRDIELAVVPNVGTWMELYAFPRERVEIADIAAIRVLKANDAKMLTLTNSSGSNKNVAIVRPDKYPFQETIINNDPASTAVITVYNYTVSDALLVLQAGESALTYNDDVNDYARLI